MHLVGQSRIRPRRRRPTGGRAGLIPGFLLVVVTALSVTTVPAAADVEQGSVTVSGEYVISQYPCQTVCSPTFGVATTGYVSGLDSSNTPFAMSWGGLPASSVAPMATLTLSLENACGGGSMTNTPIFSVLSGIVTAPSAVLVYRGVSMSATVTATFYTQVIDGDPTTVPITGMTFSAAVNGTTVLSFIASAHGVFNFLPLGDDFCPFPTSPMNFSVDGTMASLI
jgi:hypothetical protein